ncbi:MAG: SDR family NAD(P)-dependent oxidoreductase, partial [Proteobacteria bacterium]|nr:SDR family NAD(P)-dependent oxidoreductase [Pseudomonadota bacterium]
SATAIITGGSRGIGLRTAALLCEQGHRVVLVSRNAESLRKAVASLPAGQALAAPADVASLDDVRRVVTQTLEWSGRIDVLVNNAGIASTGLVEHFSPDAWDAIIATNLTAVFLCSKAVLPQMRRQRSGLIVNVVSGAGRQGYPGWSAYCASKFGVVGFAQALREEVRVDGIRVSNIFPGSVDTQIWETFPNTFDRRQMLAVDDVAGSIAWLVAQPATVWVDDLTVNYHAPVQ